MLMTYNLNKAKKKKIFYKTKIKIKDVNERN